MALTGTLVNGLAIILGTLLGLFFRNIPEKFKETVLQAVALAILLMGLDMALQVNYIIFVIIALMVGGMIGEGLKLEEKFNNCGEMIAKLIHSGQMQLKITQGFVTASLIFVVGAMAIIGALDSGLRHDHDLLFIKSILDGFTALVLTTTLGFGVGLSAIPVVLYQGAIALTATLIHQWIPDLLLDEWIIEITSTGGLLIVAIALNMLGLTKIRIANLIPALVVVSILLVGYHILIN